MSGLHKLKRSWSGNARDLAADDGSAGVVPTKTKARAPGLGASSSSSASSSSFLSAGDLHQQHQQGRLKDIKNSQAAMSRPGSQSFDADWAEECLANVQTPPPPLITTSGTKRMEETTPPPAGQSSGENHHFRKRQLPATFECSSEQAGKKGMQGKWSKSASELKAGSGDRLSFIVKGSSEKASAGRRSLEADRRVGKLFLSREQQRVYDLVVNDGKSIFFTGSAGTGKSVVLREIIRGMRKKYAAKQDAIAVTASTGIAACNISGVTLHSYAGVGLGNEPKEVLVGKVKKNRKAVSRWLRTHALFIDEISMIDPEFLEKLEFIGRSIRKSVKPFGGIQIIMTGDFFQLPPVNKTNAATRYAFDAKCWHDIAEEKINLTQVFRQKDPEFVTMLNELRFGTLSAASIAAFTSLSRMSNMEEETGLQPTRLFPLRMEVEKANAEQMVGIKRPKRTFDAIDGGTMPPEQRERVLGNLMAPKTLHLKTGCQVMLIKNTDDALVNGSVGTVMTFLSAKDWNMAQYSGIEWDGIDPAKQTEEDIDAMISRRYQELGDPERAMRKEAIAALIASEDNAPARKSRLEYHEAMEREMKKERSRSRSVSPEKVMEPRKYPVVRFLVPNSRSRTILCQPEVWKNEQPDGEVIASRSQVPLILAWAMSIHKSQGQTLPLVKIDLGRVFETGQAYVALSRAVSKEGLQVLNFNPAKVRVDKRVVDWYKTLPTIC